MNWIGMKARPTAFGDSKNWPGYSNGVNADTKPIPVEKPSEPEITPGAVPATDLQSPEQGPLEVPQLPIS